MKNICAGTIAEYDPFHKGHLYHVNRTRELTGADTFVAVMSGNFLQRGRMAVADKWERAEAAVRCGVDLVVELPAVFACNAAGYFAHGAVEILEALGVDFISFGSESGNIEELSAIAREISSGNEFISDAVKAGVKEGLTYAAARRRAAAAVLGENRAALLDSPNNVLAIEYLKEIKKAAPVTVKRAGQAHGDESVGEETASASAVRRLISLGEDVSGLIPAPSFEMVKRSASPDPDAVFRMICQKALAEDAESLDSLAAGGEGLGNKLKKVIRTAKSCEELAELLKSKRYTRTRIDRFLMQVLLDVREMPDTAGYIRVLASNQKGRSFLKELKKNGGCPLPVLTNINREMPDDPKLRKMLRTDVLASDIYNLAAGRDLYKYSDFVRMPVVI